MAKMTVNTPALKFRAILRNIYIYIVTVHGVELNRAVENHFEYKMLRDKGRGKLRCTRMLPGPDWVSTTEKQNKT